jgi:hypothetical protein
MGRGHVLLDFTSKLVRFRQHHTTAEARSRCLQEDAAGVDEAEVARHEGEQPVVQSPPAPTVRIVLLASSRKLEWRRRGRCNHGLQPFYDRQIQPPQDRHPNSQSRNLHYRVTTSAHKDQASCARPPLCSSSALRRCQHRPIRKPWH